MQDLSRRTALALPLVAAPLLNAQAQDWKPTQQVRLLIAAAPGGTTDIMARLLSPRLQSRWGRDEQGAQRAAPRRADDARDDAGAGEL
jgi:tripartite-type tricarboxylate transporter receptor subunit TctC